MKFKFIICLLLSFGSVQLFAQSKSTYEKKVDSLTQARQQEKIIPYLEKELKKQPKNEHLLRLIGFQYLQVNNTQLGEKYYRDALSVNPACARCYLNIGRIYAAKNNFTQALHYLDKALVADGKDGLIFSSRAQIKEMSGDKFGALADHNKAVEIDPENAGYYTERGIYNLNQGYSALALADFNLAITLAPDHFYPLFYRSRINMESGDLNAALEDINKAISLDDQQYRLYNFRGTIYARLKQYEKALENHSSAIQLNPDNAFAYLNRAEVYYELENMDASCQDYARAKALAQNDKNSDPELLKNIEESMSGFCDANQPSFYYQRGVALYNLKQFNKALDMYAAGLQKFPKNPMILSFNGNAYLALKDYQNATVNYDAALTNKEGLMLELENNPRFSKTGKKELLSYYHAAVAAIYYNAAECAIFQGNIEEALTAMNKAITLAPAVTDFNKETYYYRRGVIYLEMNNYELAVADFNQAILISQNDASAYISRAIAKVSIAGNLKKSNAIISAKLPHQPFRINWTIKPKASSQKAQADMISALEDCNKAIALDETIGFSYYVRGQIRYFLGYSDYCIDLIKAKKMGVEVEAQLLSRCGQT